MLSKLSNAIHCSALAAVLFTPIAQADEWNKKTVVTFSGPVEIPGVHLTGWGVLPAGTYVFKVMDSQSDRHIVQIFNKEETTVYATVLAIPNYRLKATDKTVITFSERPAGEPEALRAWFYPGRQWGEEFVYPKARAMEIAKLTNTPVLYTATELPMETATAIQSADEPVVAQLKRAPVMAIQPTGEEVQLASVVTTPPTEPTAVAETAAAVTAEEPQAQPARTVAAEPVAAPVAASEQLPATGSNMPLIALLGSMMFAFGILLAIVRKQVVTRS